MPRQKKIKIPKEPKPRKVKMLKVKSKTRKVAPRGAFSTGRKARKVGAPAPAKPTGEKLISSVKVEADDGFFLTKTYQKKTYYKEKPIIKNETTSVTKKFQDNPIERTTVKDVRYAVSIIDPALPTSPDNLQWERIDSRVEREFYVNDINDPRRRSYVTKKDLQDETDSKLGAKEEVKLLQDTINEQKDQELEDLEKQVKREAYTNIDEDLNRPPNQQRLALKNKTFEENYPVEHETKLFKNDLQTINRVISRAAEQSYEPKPQINMLREPTLVANDLIHHINVELNKIHPILARLELPQNNVNERLRRIRQQIHTRMTNYQNQLERILQDLNDRRDYHMERLREIDKIPTTTHNYYMLENRRRPAIEGRRARSEGDDDDYQGPTIRNLRKHRQDDRLSDYTGTESGDTDESPRAKEFFTNMKKRRKEKRERYDWEKGRDPTEHFRRMQDLSLPQIGEKSPTTSKLTNLVVRSTLPKQSKPRKSKKQSATTDPMERVNNAPTSRERFEEMERYVQNIPDAQPRQSEIIDITDYGHGLDLRKKLMKQAMAKKIIKQIIESL